MAIIVKYTTAESTSSTQTATINVPGLIRVVSATANTGSVSHSHTGNQVTLNFSGGAYERTSTYSYDCTAYPPTTTATQNLSSPRDQHWQYWDGSQWVSTGWDDTAPSSVSYNDGNYSGTLPQTSYSQSAYTYYTHPSNPTVNQQFVDITCSWNATYSGTVNAISKTCTGTNYYYIYTATLICEIEHRFSRNYNTIQYGRGLRGIVLP